MLKKNGILLALAAFIIVGSVNAIPDSVVTGPYKISFDMGFNHSDYNIIVNAPITTESIDGTERTDYEIAITNANIASSNKTGINKTIFSQSHLSYIMALSATGKVRTALIIIKKFPEAQEVVTTDILENVLELNDGKGAGASDFSVAPRTIDGTRGAIDDAHYNDSPNPIESYHASNTTS